MWLQNGFFWGGGAGGVVYQPYTDTPACSLISNVEPTNKKNKKNRIKMKPIRKIDIKQKFKINI